MSKKPTCDTHAVQQGFRSVNFHPFTMCELAPLQEADLRHRDAVLLSVHQRRHRQPRSLLAVALPEELLLQQAHPLHVHVAGRGQVPQVGTLQGDLSTQSVGERRVGTHACIVCIPLDCANTHEYRTAHVLTCTTRFFMSSSTIIRASASVLCGDELRELAAAAELLQLPPPLMD